MHLISSGSKPNPSLAVFMRVELPTSLKVSQQQNSWEQVPHQCSARSLFSPTHTDPSLSHLFVNAGSLLDPFQSLVANKKDLIFLCPTSLFVSLLGAFSPSKGYPFWVFLHFCTFLVYSFPNPGFSDPSHPFHSSCFNFFKP